MKTDIETSIAACKQAASDKDLSPALRAVLSLSAHHLEQCRSQMALAVVELDKAVKERAGFTATDSRHEEVARLKNRVMEEQAGFLRSLLNAVTPDKDAPIRQPRSEVI